ncbi:dihydropteroate synthase [Marivirga lumbricoides]|uniref:Dihydropteroate synthase n=1 Tax=Marivirga lumbricoides TaxID=1046115 RepID=A0ABQ1N8B2_9BACT|nr:dihydropteroate synthase [Marivirga lumbricoides]
MEAKDTAFSNKKTLLIRGTLMDLAQPRVMGIINVTPDSFYDGGKNKFMSEALTNVEKMLVDGAHFIDIGGYSTKPGAREVSLEEELDRVLPVINEISLRFPEAVLSIDTFRSQVAKHAVEAGANIINDVSGGNLDDQMFSVVSQLKVPYILMHMRGTPATMQKLNNYNHLIKDIIQELSEKLVKLRRLAVNDIVIDPGFGFAKSIPQNYEILKNLAYFDSLECPLLIGLSRKSMVYKTLGVDSAEALNGTTALNMTALMNGADILRVHDVKEAVETVKLFNTLQN